MSGVVYASNKSLLMLLRSWWSDPFTVCTSALCLYALIAQFPAIDRRPSMCPKALVTYWLGLGLWCVVMGEQLSVH